MMKPLIQIPFQNSSRLFSLPQLQCHRGYWVEGIPENTLESILEARRQGYQMVEFDVQVSADGVPVLFHDDNLIKVAKKNIQVRQLDYQDLLRLVPVSRLADILSHPEAPDYFNIEIKSKAYLNKNLVEAIMHVIKQSHVEDRMLISCFNPWCLYYLKTNYPEIVQALLVARETLKFFVRKNIFSFLLKPNLLHIDQRLVTPEFLKYIQEKAIPLAVWTVNEESKARELLAQGARSIITDRLHPKSFLTT